LLGYCKLCQRFQEYYDGLCEQCYDVLFYLKDIIEDYLKGGATDPVIINALREFTWLYAGFPRLWGYYNSIINTIYFFIINSDRDYITEVDLNYFDFTSLDKNDVLKILFESKALKEPSKSSPETYEIGELTEILSTKIGEELREDTGRFKDTAEEMFGIVSIMLTYILIQRKLNKPDEEILPRKAISLFLTFAQVILNNIKEEDDIPKEIQIDLLLEKQKMIKVSKNTQFKFLLEMMGLTYISPGIPNVIYSVDDSHKTLKLKGSIINLLENLRERRRERERVRER